MEAITTGLTTAIGYLGTVLDTITGNTILTVLFAAGTILPVAISVFRRFKKSAIR